MHTHIVYYIYIHIIIYYYIHIITYIYIHYICVCVCVFVCVCSQTCMIDLHLWYMLCCDVWFSVVLVLFVASCEVLIDPDKALLLGPATIINPLSLALFTYIYIGLFSLYWISSIYLLYHLMSCTQKEMHFLTCSWPLGQGERPLLRALEADRFRHDGDQYIPGSGHRWSYVHRTKDAQPNFKAGSSGPSPVCCCQPCNWMVSLHARLAMPLHRLLRPVLSMISLQRSFCLQAGGSRLGSTL